MNRPSQSDVYNRRAAIALRLRNQTPKWTSESGHLDLFLSADGLLIIRNNNPKTDTPYLGVNQKGEVRDLSGFPIDSGDVHMAQVAVGSAGFTVLAAKIVARYSS
jgi:hypothetical protein